MARLPNPPKTKRLTKKLAVETMRVLDAIDFHVFTMGRPDLWRGVDWPCLSEWRDRLLACRAHLHTWYDNEKRRKRK